EARSEIQHPRSRSRRSTQRFDSRARQMGRPGAGGDAFGSRFITTPRKFVTIQKLRGACARRKLLSGCLSFSRLSLLLSYFCKDRHAWPWGLWENRLPFFSLKTSAGSGQRLLRLELLS